MVLTQKYLLFAKKIAGSNIERAISQIVFCCPRWVLLLIQPLYLFILARHLAIANALQTGHFLSESYKSRSDNF